MANVQHASLTDPELHEPKGVAAASEGEVYVADGAGSGDWLLAEDIAATKSLGNNGYLKLPGGLIIQWGRYNLSVDGPTTVNFSVTFPTACVYVNAQNTNTTKVIGVSSFTTSSLVLDRDDDINGTYLVTWMALGY